MRISLYNCYRHNGEKACGKRRRGRGRTGWKAKQDVERNRIASARLKNGSILSLCLWNNLLGRFNGETAAGNLYPPPDGVE
jgi:hypothetical protein